MLIEECHTKKIKLSTDKKNSVNLPVAEQTPCFLIKTHNQDEPAKKQNQAFKMPQ